MRNQKKMNGKGRRYYRKIFTSLAWEARLFNKKISVRGGAPPPPLYSKKDEKRWIFFSFFPLNHVKSFHKLQDNWSNSWIILLYISREFMKKSFSFQLAGEGWKATSHAQLPNLPQKVFRESSSIYNRQFLLKRGLIRL